MGNNQPTSKWKSPMEDDQDEREVQEWLKWKVKTPSSCSNSKNEKVQKLIPGLDVLAVQPVYLTEDVKDSKKKHTHRYSYSQTLARTQSFDKEIFGYGRISEAKKHKTLQNNNSVSLDELKNSGHFHADLNENSLSDLRDLDEKYCKFPTGELNVSLSYEPTSNRMKVFIVKAKNLTCGEKRDKFGVNCSENKVGYDALPEARLHESFINVALITGHNIHQANTTSLKKNGHVEILFYENFSFYLKKNLLKTAILEIKAMHRCKNILKSSHVVGRVLIGGISITDVTETKQWYDAIANPRQVITKWHTIWC